MRGNKANKRRNNLYGSVKEVGDSKATGKMDGVIKLVSHAENHREATEKQNKDGSPSGIAEYLPSKMKYRFQLFLSNVQVEIWQNGLSLQE